jgi:hypothetical protein
MLDETLIADFYRALLRSENSTLCVSPKISNALRRWRAQIAVVVWTVLGFDSAWSWLAESLVTRQPCKGKRDSLAWQTRENGPLTLSRCRPHSNMPRFSPITYLRPSRRSRPR